MNNNGKMLCKIVRKRREYHSIHHEILSFLSCLLSVGLSRNQSVSLSTPSWNFSMPILLSLCPLHHLRRNSIEGLSVWVLLPVNELKLKLLCLVLLCCIVLCICMVWRCTCVHMRFMWRLGFSSSSGSIKPVLRDSLPLYWESPTRINWLTHKPSLLTLSYQAWNYKYILSCLVSFKHWIWRMKFMS